jgi:hypothetical protein
MWEKDIFPAQQNINGLKFSKKSYHFCLELIGWIVIMWPLVMLSFVIISIDWSNCCHVTSLCKVYWSNCYHMTSLCKVIGEIVMWLFCASLLVICYQEATLCCHLRLVGCVGWLRNILCLKLIHINFICVDADIGLYWVAPPNMSQLVL